jgi:hypothetical protein
MSDLSPLSGAKRTIYARSEYFAFSQTRTHIPDRATVISIRKNILTRAGIPGLEPKSGHQTTRVRVSYMERKSTSKFKFLQAIAILSMTIATP